MVRLLPGDVIDVLLGADTQATPEVREQARKQLGLDGSYAEQYWRWASGAVQGDLGDSLAERRAGLRRSCATPLPITLELVFLGLLIAVVVGVPLGVDLGRAARQRRATTPRASPA